MKFRKPIAVMLTAVMLGTLLTGCFSAPPAVDSMTPLEEAAETYTPEQAEREGCLVQQDWIAQGDGLDLLNSFMAEETDTLRVANFKTDEENCRVYEVTRVKDGFLLRSPGEEDRTYTYLRKEKWVQSIPGGGIPNVGSIATNTSYFLCDRNDVSYLDCMMSQTGTQMGEKIPFFTVLTEFNGQTNSFPNNITIPNLDPDEFINAGALWGEKLMEQCEETLSTCYEKLRDSGLAEETAKLMQDMTIQVMKFWGETFPAPEDYRDVEAWFDALRQEAEKLADQMGLDKLKEEFRGHWLLLQ